MISMKINKIFLLLTLTLLLLGLTYATDTTNETTNTDTLANKIQTTNTPTHIVEDNTNSREHYNKEINKEYIKNTKTTSQTVDVNDYKTLHNTLTSNEYDNITLNIKTDIQLTNNTTISNKITQLTINGNEKTINGNNQNSFLHINSNTHVTIKNIKIRNCTNGAINNKGTLTIINTTLQYNKADYGGAIDNTYGNLIIINSTLNNNKAPSGGTIYNTIGNLTIENTILNNNTADYGGVIMNAAGRITILNSTLNNNKANQYGGIIHNGDYGTIIILNSTLNNNNAENLGGAIYNNKNDEKTEEGYPTITINNSILNNNTADYGGAIYNHYGNITITNTKLQYNNAEYGGAIYHEHAKISIESNNFEKNNANYGAAIYSNDNTIIKNNIFTQNNASSLIPPAINDYGTNTIIKDNQNENKTKYYSTIYIEGENNNITNNRFYDEKNTLKITLDPIKTITYGHHVTITGTLTDNDENPRTNSALKITINGKSISTRTNNNGKFNVTSKVGIIGTNNVTASHTGDVNHYPTNTSTTFTMIKQNLNITVNKIETIQYGNNITITGTFTDADGNPRTNNKLNININGKTGSATTDKNGKYTFTSIIGKVGTNNVTLSHTGGTNYNPTSTSTTYTMTKQNLKITLEEPGRVTYGPVTIKGKLTDTLGKIRTNTGVKLLINGKSATAKTDNNGLFSFTTKSCKVGTNNITATHNGGGNYNPTSTNITLTMIKQDLKVTINPITTVTYGNNVIITGTLTDANNNIRANSALKIIINGKTLTTRTDTNGRYNATSKVGIVGTNNVTVSHSGGTGFNPTSTNTIFKMIKQDLKITINPINNVKKGSNITITGTFTDTNNKIRTNTNLKVNLNGKEYTTKTDSKGVFTYTTTANKLGTNTAIISHTGGTNYNPTSSEITFTVVKLILNDHPPF